MTTEVTTPDVDDDTPFVENPEGLGTPVQYVTFDDVTNSAEVSTQDVKISAGYVKVKGLTRYEYTLALKISAASGAEGVNMSVLEMGILQYGVVLPKLDKSKAEKWYKSGSAGDIDKVLDAIKALSGMGKDADKSDEDES